jgi:hypothetical protein
MPHTDPETVAVVRAAAIDKYDQDGDTPRLTVAHVLQQHITG